MQTTAVRIKPYLVQVTIRESGAEFEKAKQAVIADIRDGGRVKGFKKGSNIPDSVIIREYGDAMIESQAVDKIVERLYPKMLKKENIVPVAPGNISQIVSTSPLEFIIEVETAPVLDLDMKKIKAIKVKKTSISVDESEVDAEISAIQKKFTHFHTAGVHSDDGADTSHTQVESGDRVTLSAQGYDKKGGDAIPETAVPHYPLIVGSNSFIPGFEEKLVGSKVDDEVGFEITFPADYHSEDFKNRVVYFTANIEKIEKPHTEEFTPEFIEKLRGKKTDMAGLRDILRGEIGSKKEYEVRAQDEDILMEKLLSVCTIDVGPGLLKSEIDRVYAEQTANMEQQGYKIKDYLQHTRQTEEEYREKTISPQAMRRVQAEVLLSAIRTAQDISATDVEVSAEVEKVIAQYGSPEVVERLRAKLVPGDTYYAEIADRVAYRKVVDMFWE